MSIINMLLKIVFGSQIRLFDCRQTPTLEAMHAFIQKTFPHVGKYSLYYFDQENDQIILETKQDLAVYLESFDKKPKIHINKIESETQIFEKSVLTKPLQEKYNQQKHQPEKVQQAQQNQKIVQQVKPAQICPPLQREEKKQEVELQKEKNNYILHDVECKNCKERPIKNVRYRCARCEDLNLCQLCYIETTHKELHPFVKIRDPHAAPESVRIKVEQPAIKKEQQTELKPQKDQQLQYQNQHQRQQLVVSYLQSLFGQENYPTYSEFARQSNQRKFKKIYEDYIGWMTTKNQPNALKRWFGWIGGNISKHFNKFRDPHNE